MISLNPSATSRQIYVDNIIGVYQSATASQIYDGRMWYTTAHQLADIISGGNPRAGAGVLAALSVNKSWPENQRLAGDAFTGNLHGHVGDALRKAGRIMEGVDPEDVLPMDLKTGNFYRCILDPSDTEAVVIDRHAHDLAINFPMGNEDRGLGAKKRYSVMSLAYRNAAAELDELPMDVQAITWLVWRERIANTSTRGALK